MKAVQEARQSQLEFPQWNPVTRRFLPDSPFFASGNLERQLLAKHPAIELDNHQNHQVEIVLYDDDAEANMKRHTASCCVCSTVYPTSRLLSIHVSEAHGCGFFQAKVARGYAMYECFVEGCGLKLRSCETRRQHLVECHCFATSSLGYCYFFDRANNNQVRDMEVENERMISGLVSAMSKLSTCSESNRMRKRKRKKDVHEKPAVCESDQRVSKCMRT